MTIVYITLGVWLIGIVFIWLYVRFVSIHDELPGHVLQDESEIKLVPKDKEPKIHDTINV